MWKSDYIGICLSYLFIYTQFYTLWIILYARQFIWIAMARITATERILSEISIKLSTLILTIAAWIFISDEMENIT